MLAPCAPLFSSYRAVVRYRESRSEPYAGRQQPIVITNRASVYGPSRSESAIDMRKVGRLAPSRYGFALSKLDRCDARDADIRAVQRGRVWLVEDRKVFE